MATQRLTMATFAGQAAIVVAARFGQWRDAPDPVAVDRLCVAIRAHALSLPVVYFAEWVDRWLMGDMVPGPDKVAGQQFEACALSPEQAVSWACRCGEQFAECRWLATRLREAASGWGFEDVQYTVVVIREVVGATTDDDEVRVSLDHVPAWLEPPDPAAGSVSGNS